MREKYLKMPPSWILGIVKRELNLFDLHGNGTVDHLHDEHDKAWRTRDRTVDNILLSGFGTNIILSCYVSL
jgi:hypothetical protein